MPQLRQNIITGEWVVIAPERAKRPSDFVSAGSLKPQLKADCVFCVENKVYKEQSLKEFETDQIYVIPNSYPAFLEDPHQSSTRSYPVEDGFYIGRPATGGHDVLIVKPHDHGLFDLSGAIVGDLLTVAQKRYRYWRNDQQVSYSMLIYNNGPEAGASIAHPHAQLFASSIIPNQISRELQGTQRYYESHGTCVYCDIINHEVKQKMRVIAETTDFVAFTFFAARFPFETWVMPKRHVAVFEEESELIVKGAGEMLSSVLKRIGSVLQHPSLNFYLHDAPSDVNNNRSHYHWHIEIAPRVSTYGGYELGSGTIIDVMSPEKAAEYLRGESPRE